MEGTPLVVCCSMLWLFGHHVSTKSLLLVKTLPQGSKALKGEKRKWESYARFCTYYFLIKELQRGCKLVIGAMLNCLKLWVQLSFYNFWPEVRLQCTDPIVVELAVREVFKTLFSCIIGGKQYISLVYIILLFGLSSLNSEFFMDKK